jgi:hypothetical protein
VFNWRIVLGGAASAAILTAGVAAPAFAVPRASSPVPLGGITQSLSGSQAGEIFCGLPDLPMSVGVTTAAGAIGESCGSAQANSGSQSILTPQQASAPQAGRQGASQDIGLSSGQTNGPARTASAPQAAGASSALSGLNSVSGAIPSLGNAAGAVPNAGGSASSGSGSPTDVANLIPGNGPGGLSSAVNGVTGGLSGSQNGSQNGGPATGPLP